ncbi:hypothetical protein, partial [Nocardia sp. NPDC059239]|uniref:hypothetical protein n=1 Tax=Nocardia sp. NPDC059239 TaxID=3346785 RepID=UPI00369388E0
SAQDQNTGDMIDHQAPVGNPGPVNHANRARSIFHVLPTNTTEAAPVGAASDQDRAPETGASVTSDLPGCLDPDQPAPKA